MTNAVDSAAEVLPTDTNADVPATPLVANVIQVTADDLAYGKRTRVGAHDGRSFTETGRFYDRKEWKAHEERVRAGEVLFRPNYYDNPDPAVLETVEKLVDTSKVIELEHIDLNALPKRRDFKFVKRTFDIVACSVALVVCVIPMAVIAIAVKMDSPGPVFYSQTRFGWSIIGQKSGAASVYALRTAPSALEANSCRGIPSAFEGRPVIPLGRIASNVFAFSQVKNVHESFPRDKQPGVAT